MGVRSVTGGLVRARPPKECAFPSLDGQARRDIPDVVHAGRVGLTQVHGEGEFAVPVAQLVAHCAAELPREKRRRGGVPAREKAEHF
eukprot:2778490-Pleurochrysis_carterae.AAC.1